jgi:hypothetical protein
MRPSALESIKTTEARETLLLVMEDVDAKKLMVAWTLYRPEFKDRPLAKDESLDNAWINLWDSIGYINYNKLAQLAGIPYQTAIITFSRLRDCHLIFPDGSISLNAKNIIASEVANHLKVILPKYGNSKMPPPSEPPLKSTPQLPSGPPRKVRVPQPVK